MTGYVCCRALASTRSIHVWRKRCFIRVLPVIWSLTSSLVVLSLLMWKIIQCYWHCIFKMSLFMDYGVILIAMFMSLSCGSTLLWNWLMTEVKGCKTLGFVSNDVSHGAFRCLREYLVNMSYRAGTGDGPHTLILCELQTIVCVVSAQSGDVTTHDKIITSSLAEWIAFSSPNCHRPPLCMWSRPEATQCCCMYKQTWGF